MDKRIIDLRHSLFENAELSHKEVKTKQILIDFLKQHTTLEIVDKGEYFYAIHKEEGPHVAFRADMDAISGRNGTYHGCGHDGHCASLAAFGLWLEGKCVGKCVYLLFQSAEEVGEGATLCLDFIKEEKIEEIYGYHNIPGFPVNHVLVKDGPFASASKGLSILVHGRQTHAATPELGENPGFAIAKVISEFDCICDASFYKGMVQITLVHVKVGDKAFGVSAGEGELCLTIRAHRSEDLNLLQERILESINMYANGMSVEYKEYEPFEDTTNHTDIFKKAISALRETNLPMIELNEPFRWSEDFGLFLKQTKGCFFGIGVGEDWPALHTPEYEFNDEILNRAVELFVTLVKM